MMSAASSACFHAGLPTPWPARDSMRTSTGCSSGVEVAACSRAANLRAWSGSTRESDSAVVISVAGYRVPSTTCWYGE